MEQVSGGLTQPSDAGKGREGVVNRWLMEWELAGKREKKWRERAGKVMQRYRAEEERRSTSFNILWANTEILRPAVYNSTPRPDVRRRFRMEDPTGRQVSEVLERALSYSMDCYDFDYVMGMAVLDDLLPGRGVTRVRFEPKFTDEKLAYADVRTEPVLWDKFRHGPGQRWEDVTWVGFEHGLTKEEFKKLAPKLIDRVQYDYNIDVGEEVEQKKRDENPEVFKRIRVIEIWDKDTRKVLFIAPSIKDMPAQELDDPLNLQEFFPIPRPLMAVDSSDNLVPVEEFRMYKDQADELDRVTRRINRLINGLKLRGIYDSTIKEFDDLMKQDDNALIPTDSATVAMQMGGLDKAVWMLPIEQAAKVLKELYLQREQIKQVIYEITGISDVLRGSTDPNETLGAQQLKAQNGSMRIQRRQREVQRYVRDLLRMKSEIIAEKFTPQLLTMMTGIQVTPEMQMIMRQDLLRSFRIDIETDSTIAADQAADREMVTEMITGIGNFVESVAPAVESGVIQKETAKKIMLSAVRRFKFGREVEDAIDQEMNAPMPPQGDSGQAEQAQAQAQLQEKQLQVQADMQKHQADIADKKEQRGLEAQAKSEELQLKREELIGNLQVKARELDLKERELALKEQDLQLRAQSDAVNNANTEAQTRATLEPVEAQQNGMIQLTGSIEELIKAILQGQQQSNENNERLIAVISAPKRGMKDKQTGEFIIQSGLN